MRKLYAMGDRVIVKAVEQAKQKGSIILPGTAEETPQFATVIDFSGDAGSSHYGWLAKGQTIVIPKFAGQKVDLDGEEFIIIGRADVLARVVDMPA